MLAAFLRICYFAFNLNHTLDGLQNEFYLIHSAGILENNSCKSTFNLKETAHGRQRFCHYKAFKPSLKEIFLTGWEHCRVILFSVPCGCGKTTTATALLAGHTVCALNAADAEFLPENIPPDCDAVLWAVEKGVTVETFEKTFSPANACTRVKIVTFLYQIPVNSTRLRRSSMKKRILSILLCLCMVISLLPVTAQAADVDWSTMYASGSVIKPTPSDWTSGNNVAWAAADGGVKMSNAFSTASDRYFAAMLDIPDNAYYNLDFTLNGNSPVGAYMGYIVGNSVLGPSHAGYDNAWSWGVDMDSNDYKYYTGLDNGVTTANGTPKSWSLTGLRGTSVQFDYILVSGTDQSVDNYMVISGVKFTRLTNKVAVTPSGTGSGTFDVSSGADFNQTGTAMTSAYSADIGRGSQITLTAHPAAGSYFDHWEDSDGASISTDISITVTVGESAADTADRTFNPVFNSGTNPNVTKLLDGNARNELTGGNLCITHMGSSWSAPTWGILDALRSSIGS